MVPDPALDQLRLELRSLRAKLGEVRQLLQKTQEYFDTLIRSLDSIHGHILDLGEYLYLYFENRTGIEASKAELLIPAGMATNAKKAVKRWPDPIQKNANKALSTGRRPAKPAGH